MKITICGSVDRAQEIKKIADELKDLGFEAIIPTTSEKILRGEFSSEEIRKEKESNTFSERTIEFDARRAYCEIIKQ